MPSQSVGELVLDVLDVRPLLHILDIMQDRRSRRGDVLISEVRPAHRILCRRQRRVAGQMDGLLPF
jgi:hypothetical protein